MQRCVSRVRADSVTEQNTDFEESLLNGCLLQCAWTEIKCDLLGEAEPWRAGVLGSRTCWLLVLFFKEGSSLSAAYFTGTNCLL